MHPPTYFLTRMHHSLFLLSSLYSHFIPLLWRNNKLPVLCFSHSVSSHKWGKNRDIEKQRKYLHKHIQLSSSFSLLCPHSHFTFFPSTHLFLFLISSHDKIPLYPSTPAWKFSIFSFPKRPIRLNCYLLRRPASQFGRISCLSGFSLVLSIWVSEGLPDNHAAGCYRYSITGIVVGVVF